jgi:hypothetical protein
MASNPFNALMDPAQIGQSITNAFQMGQQQRQRADTRNALVEYARNPSPESADALLMYDPMLGMQLQDREAKRAEAAAEREAKARQAELQRRAAGGDEGALAELAGIDLNAWNTIGDQERQAVTERTKILGNAALDIARLPPQNRPQAWDAYLDQLSRAFPELAEYRGQYSEEALRGVISQAQLTQQFIDATTPKPFNVGPGEGRYERDPISGEIRTIVEPNLHGAAAFSPTGGPQPGAVEDGYRFNGGDPADQNNWEPVGGGSGNATGGFRP